MNKEECEKALNSFCDNCKYGYDCKIMKKYNGCVQMNTLNQLIKEHFDLVKKIEWLKEEMTEPAFNLVFSTQEFLHNWYKGIQMYSAENDVLKRKVSEYENPQPYKFEDLKELIGKPIFDYKYKEFYILAEVKEEELYKDEGLEKIMICSDKKGLLRVFFEEGRFYPITKALEYQK